MMTAPEMADRGTDSLRVPRRISRFALEQRSRLRDDKYDGLRRLMWALLKDTLRCYQTHVDDPTVRGQRMFREARAWFHSGDSRWVFSFENVSMFLNIDSDRFRVELVRWTRRRQARNEVSG